MANPSSLNSEQLETLTLLRDSLPFYAENVLKIRDEAGGISPLIFNDAQNFIHLNLEKQLKEQGNVRAVIVKSRQMGASTYLAARYFHKASLNAGKTVFIMAHKATSTKMLYDMARRYYDEAPEPLRPAIKASNARELIFDKLNSQYYVGTAGSKAEARGGTIQCFHGSEVAFWEHTDDLETGVMQAVPDLPGTEIVLESTANGLGNMFHRRYLQSLNPNSDYQLIFMPWYWMPKYERHVPDEMQLTPEEEELIQLYLGDYSEETQLRKLAWRRNKVEDFGKIWKFKQEYPSTAQEAFLVTGGSLVRPEHIVKARRCNKRDLNAPIVIGVDSARNRDRTAVTIRRGREIRDVLVYDEMDEMTMVGILIQLDQEYKPIMINIDCAHGYGVSDRLKEIGFKHVNPVHFGAQAIENKVYANKRAEMAGNMEKFFALDDINIPDRDDIHADILAVPDFKTTSDGASRLPSKDEIKKAYGQSPDIADSIMLTFAYPVRRQASGRQIQKANKNEATWKHGIAKQGG